MNRAGSRQSHAVPCHDDRNLFASAAASRKLVTWNLMHLSFRKDQNMCPKRVRAERSFACRRSVMLSIADSLHRQDSAPASYSIATLPIRVASLPLFGAGSWLTWEECGIRGPSSCSGRMGHAVPCAARHHIGSAKEMISKPSSPLRTLSRCIEVGKYLLLSALDTCLPSRSGHAGLIHLVGIHRELASGKHRLL